MRSLLLGSIAALAIGSTGALAQSTGDANAAMKPAPAASASSTNFVDKQEAGVLRAPKLVGVAVYDSNNKSVGKIDDLLLDHDGKITTVVIGVGGFLGIGKKDVALPYSAVHWQTEARTVAVNGAPPANPVGQTSTSATPGANNATANNGETQKTIAPAETEAYNGYPDRAVLDVSQDQLKAAPEFKYATDPATKVGTDPTAPAAAQKP